MVIFKKIDCYFVKINNLIENYDYIINMFDDVMDLLNNYNQNLDSNCTIHLLWFGP